MMGIPEERNPLIVEARNRGLHPSSIREIEIVGVGPKEIQIPEFKLPKSFGGNRSVLLRVMGSAAKTLFTVFPFVLDDSCTSCGVCKKACPRGAITIAKTAWIDRKKCIRCYCCHEMCQFHAIELRQGMLSRLVNKR
jgi:ferredoxin